MIGPGWRTIARAQALGSATEEVAEILRQAREARWAELPRHTGSGRMLTTRRLQLTYNPVPPPLTPFVPTPVVSSLQRRAGGSVRFTALAHRTGMDAESGASPCQS